MPKKRYNAEEIIHKLREADALQGQGDLPALTGHAAGQIFPSPPI